MASQSSKEELREKLKDREEAIEGHYQALKEEVTSASDVVSNLVKKRPVAGAVLALGAGLLVGAILGKRRNNGHRGRSALADGVADVYLDRIAASAVAAMEKGREPHEAVRQAVGNHLPVVAAPEAREDDASSRSLLGSLLGAGARILLQSALYSAYGFLTDRLNGDPPEAAHPTNGREEAP